MMNRVHKFLYTAYPLVIFALALIAMSHNQAPRSNPEIRIAPSKNTKLLH